MKVEETFVNLGDNTTYCSSKIISQLKNDFRVVMLYNFNPSNQHFHHIQLIHTKWILVKFSLCVIKDMGI